MNKKTWAARIAVVAVVAALVIGWSVNDAEGTSGNSNHCTAGLYQVRFEGPGSMYGFTITEVDGGTWTWTYSGDWTVEEVWVFAGGRAVMASTTPGTLDTEELGLTNHRGIGQDISHVDFCKGQPDTTTTTPPTTTPPTTVPETTTTTAPEPELEALTATAAQSCDDGLVVTVTNPNDVDVDVDVNGREVVAPAGGTVDVVFDLPVAGYTWTIYVTWDGGGIGVTLSDLGLDCDPEEPPTTVPPTEEPPAPSADPDPTPRDTLPNTGSTTDKLVAAGIVLAFVGGSLLGLGAYDRWTRRRYGIG